MKEVKYLLMWRWYSPSDDTSYLKTNGLTYTTEELIVYRDSLLEDAHGNDIFVVPCEKLEHFNNSNPPTIK